MSELLTRSFQTEMEATGRTLEGLAFRWNTPSRVSDGGPSYLEAFANGAADKTIKERGTVPLAFMHPYTPGSTMDPTPLGAVNFRVGTDGLEFTAKLSETRRADEFLSLVNDGAVKDVSVGFRAHKSSKRGDVVFRTEIGLLELSLVPTGLAAHQGAEVLAVRQVADQMGTPRLDALRKRAVFL